MPVPLDSNGFMDYDALENLLKEQALKRAQERVNYISHQMTLEHQEVSQEEKEIQIRRLAEELLKAPQKLWEE